MTHHRGAAWFAMLAALAALGCSGGGAGRGGEQPYGAGTSAKRDELPESGVGAEPAGIGGEGGVSGVNTMAGVGGVGGMNELPACDGTSRPATIGACVTFPEPMAGEHLSITGVVEAIEQPDNLSCAHRALGFMADATAKEVYDVVVRDGKSTVRVSVRLPSNSPFVSVGETVSVDYLAELPLDSVGHGALTVRDKEGALLLWMVQAANGFDSIGIPELMIRDTKHDCSVSVPCGTSTHGGIHAFDGRDEVSIPYAQISELGDLVVMVGDNTKITVADTCSATRSFHRVVIAAVDARVLSLIDDD